MSLDETINIDSVISAPIEDTKGTEKPRKKPRAELRLEGELVLTKKLSPITNLQLLYDRFRGRVEKITHPQMKEHLPEEEEKDFVTKIDIKRLRVGGMIEVWEQISGSKEYIVTEYRKLKK